MGLHALKLALEEELSLDLGTRTIDVDMLGREMRIKPGDKVHKDTFDFVCQDGLSCKCAQPPFFLHFLLLPSTPP